jgi:general secretion pathway protein D
MQSDSGSFTGFYGDDKIMALITAMQTKKYGRILANPKLLVDDNREGTIETKRTTFIERKTTNIQPQEGGTAITTENVEFQPYDEKVNLKIKPHISKGDNLRLEIELTRSDFEDYSATSTKPPNNAESNVKTVVTVPNSSTIILGGLDKIKQQKGGSKVPILGDIPLVGGLFRTTDNKSDEKKLYIFIKPHILRPGENLSNRDMKKLSGRYRSEFEEREAEMQTYQDWPGLDSQPMTPVKVLEEDEETPSDANDTVEVQIP